MLSVIAIILSSISIILMIIILVKFKKLFSTESIIEKTKAQMNRVIIDVNNNANRDIELINDSSKRVRALLNDADRKMEMFKEATQRLRDMIAETENNNKKNQHKPNIYIDPDAAYSVNINKQPERQQSLFEEENVEKPKSILKDETIVRPDGTAYKEVPFIITKVYDDKKINENTTSNKPIEEKVRKLFNQGMQVDEIAAELSCSISEIQFIIDML